MAVWADKPCLGGLLVAATKEWHIVVMEDAAKKAVATRVRRGHKAPKAANGEME